jgi:hypothetical protein
LSSNHHHQFQDIVLILKYNPQPINVTSHFPSCPGIYCTDLPVLTFHISGVACCVIFGDWLFHLA